VTKEANPQHLTIPPYPHERTRNLWSLLKRGIKGTYVSVEPYHLFRYLDEQSFRFNEREDEDKDRFAKTLGQVAGRRLTYDQLTGKS
jgi:ISXO2-like transposase domain